MRYANFLQCMRDLRRCLFQIVKRAISSFDVAILSWSSEDMDGIKITWQEEYVDFIRLTVYNIKWRILPAFKNNEVQNGVYDNTGCC